MAELLDGEPERRAFSQAEVQQSRVITVGDGWIEDLDGRWRVYRFDHGIWFTEKDNDNG